MSSVRTVPKPYTPNPKALEDEEISNTGARLASEMAPPNFLRFLGATVKSLGRPTAAMNRLFSFLPWYTFDAVSAERCPWSRVSDLL